MKYLTGYTLKQWLIGLYLFFEEYINSYTAKEHLIRALKAAFYTAMIILCIVDIYALYLILWSLG